MNITTSRPEGRMIGRILLVILILGILVISFIYKILTNTMCIDLQRTNKRLTTLDLVKYEDRSVADALAQRVRVLCWVMTHPGNHEDKARHVKATWGKRCNILLFMSSVQDNTLPSIKLPLPEGRAYLWGKTKFAFRYVYRYHRNDADWFLKADDDTYVVVENLRYMLAEYDSNSPIYFGFRFNKFLEEGYMSGGAGYVLSRNALDRFVEEALPSPSLCKDDDIGVEDLEIGKCLAKVGVKAMDSRDKHHRGRFFPFTPQHHLFPTKNKSWWYWANMYYRSKDGLDCCSDHAITFHYISSKHMHVLDYLIYHLRPYGIDSKFKPRNNQTNAPSKI